MHGSHVDSLDEAKRQFQVARDKWLEWADLAEMGEALAVCRTWDSPCLNLTAS